MVLHQLITRNAIAWESINQSVDIMAEKLGVSLEPVPMPTRNRESDDLLRNERLAKNLELILTGLSTVPDLSVEKDNELTALRDELEKLKESAKTENTGKKTKKDKENASDTGRDAT